MDSQQTTLVDYSRPTLLRQSASGAVTEETGVARSITFPM
jgi:hypothetical protein